jgi:hypothetical protein
MTSNAKKVNIIISRKIPPNPPTLPLWDYELDLWKNYVLPAIRPIDREIPLPQVNAGIAASRRMLSVLS